MLKILWTNELLMDGQNDHYRKSKDMGLNYPLACKQDRCQVKIQLRDGISYKYMI